MAISSNIVIFSLILLAFAGIPFLFLNSVSAGQRIGGFFTAFASVSGLLSVIHILLLRGSVSWELYWGLPYGPAKIAIDPLSALFLVPVFLIPCCSTIYGLWYRPAHKNSDRFFYLCLGVLASSMGFVILSRNAVLFLISWEIMALSCYFMLTVDDANKEVREAGLLYLVATHTGTLFLLAMFGIMYHETGSMGFPSAGTLSIAAPASAFLFITALLGFGAKAGLFPLHVWLPSAHANAPSHASAIMSGVILKIGIYGLVRVLSFFSAMPVWWGGLLLVAGAVSALAGVAFALGQHDIKRLLAYHSIENIGIITMGLGVAVIGVSTGNKTVALLGIGGALLHTLNHAIFKALLFYGAGAVIHISGSREIDQSGGVIRLLPHTGLFFLIGSVAICGLPPLNGFISEFLVYLALFREVIAGEGIAVALSAIAIPALALVGGLAVACFVKVFGVVFLGEPRKAIDGAHHHESWKMTLPMGILAALCIFIGIGSPFVMPLVEAASASWHPSFGSGVHLVAGIAPLLQLSIVNLLLLSIIALLAIWYRWMLKKRPPAVSDTWGCGYVAPTPRMQYTASSFAAPLVGLLTTLLRPRSKRPVVTGYFPKPAAFYSHIPEVVLDNLIMPMILKVEHLAAPLRKMQNGKLHLYMLYVFATLFALMVWAL